MAAKKKATKKKSSRRYWLFKSEPNSYSIDDLAGERMQTTFWDGVRNYQARNFLRDDVAVGDRVFFYYSNSKPMGIAGTMEVVREGYPDHTAFDPDDHHYDPKSDPDEPTWFMVDVKLIQSFPALVTRGDLKSETALAKMMVLQRGSRLSIQPVTAAEWKAVHKLAGVKDL
ncbi:MAG: EVE domain-containing protein [Planctomycetota bacterium]|nr:MAG: EVE domain-containing protein [Planctomycetota bacterium]REK21161.1 MAG: EVE domain-containing protein [Planctomycetota bacterium]REK29569.1 MAG: EVE domain-containing protein [Planctomycetota bacterium]